MSSSTSQQQAVPNPSGVSNDEVDLRQIVGALSRNINIIAAFAGTTLLLSSIYAFTRKDVAGPISDCARGTNFKNGQAR